MLKLYNCCIKYIFSCMIIFLKKSHISTLSVLPLFFFGISIKVIKNINLQLVQQIIIIS